MTLRARIRRDVARLSTGAKVSLGVDTFRLLVNTGDKAGFEYLHIPIRIDIGLENPF
jgi:hypothetical protein